MKGCSIALQRGRLWPHQNENKGLPTRTSRRIAARRDGDALDNSVHRPDRPERRERIAAIGGSMHGRRRQAGATTASPGTPAWSSESGEPLQRGYKAGISALNAPIAGFVNPKSDPKCDLSTVDGPCPRLSPSNARKFPYLIGLRALAPALESCRGGQAAG